MELSRLFSGHISAAFSKLKEQQQNYRDCCSQSTDVVNELVNTNLELTYLPHAQWGVFSCDKCVQDKVEFYLEEKLLRLEQSVRAALREKAQVAHDMMKTVNTLENQVKEAAQKFGVDVVVDAQTLGTTMPVSSFVHLTQEISHMHQQDLLMKQTLMTDITTQEEHDTLMIYISSWLMCPFIDQKRIKEIYQMVDIELEQINNVKDIVQ